MSGTRKERILVVDDAVSTVEVLHRNLTAEGYSVLTANSVPDAVEVLSGALVDLVITDLKMPKVSGLDLVRHVRENCKDTEVMMITGYATVNGAVKAMKVGAEEYLAKPFTEQELFLAVRRTLDKLSLRRMTDEDGASETPERYGMLGTSTAMREVFKAVAKATATPVTILLTGESGTGKELVARAIHYSSRRASFPFVPVNCGGIPETLLESELFGRIKGAFTGADETRAGFFQTADRGTIFLDEISETSPAMQVKLLRVLQDKEVCLVGSTKARKVDVRIVAATNRDLEAYMRTSGFREDLYYRLNVINIHLPPLRERGDDVMLLVPHFAARFAGELGVKQPQFSDRAMQVLRGYAWPGNVRELENMVQRLVAMADGDVMDVPDLPAMMRFSADREVRLGRTLAQVEAEHIRRVLESVEDNKTRAAEILGIDRKTLREKLKRLS